MENFGIYALVTGGILAIIGTIALVTAYRTRITTLEDRHEQETSLAVSKEQLNNVLHTHALTQAKLENTETELSTIKLNIAETAGKLKAFGVIHDDTDILALEQSDIIIEATTPQTAPTQSDAQLEALGLPTVPGLETQQLIETLLHAANRTGPRSDRPFSRRYMVDNGPLTFTKFQHLLDALESNNYIEKIGNSPTLTARGQALLQRVKNGQF